MDDYERTIHAISNESLLSLVERLSHIIPRLQLLAYICDLKISSYNVNSDDDIPCGVKLLNKIHGCLFEFRFPHYLFLKMLLYMFESCCLAYFKYLFYYYEIYVMSFCFLINIILECYQTGH